MRVIVVTAALLSAALLPACTVGRVQINRPARAALPPVTAVLDCLQRNNLALVAARNGRRGPQEAESSLESFDRVNGIGPVMIETGVAASADGVLMLIADPVLQRTTTGNGPVAGKSYPELRRLFLKDGRGRVAEERMPTLEEGLLWAKRNGAYLMLRPVAGVPVARLVADVRTAGMQNQVILVADSAGNAAAMLRADAAILVAARARSAADIAALRAASSRRLAVVLSPAASGLAVQARQAGLIVVQESPATTANAGGAALAPAGAALILSDWPAAAWQALKSAGRDGQRCL